MPAHEDIQHVLEASVKSIEFLLKYEIINQDEAEKVVRTRRAFEYKLRSTHPKLAHFLKAIDFELQLDAKRKLCCSDEQAEIKKFNYMFQRVCIIYRRGMKALKGKDSSTLFKCYVEFLKDEGKLKLLSHELARRLKTDPRNVDLWEMAAQHEAQSSIETARRLMLQAINVNKSCSRLYILYFDLEMAYCTKLVEEWLLAKTENDSAIESLPDGFREVMLGSVPLHVYKCAVEDCPDACARAFHMQFLETCCKHRWTADIADSLVSIMWQNRQTSDLAVKIATRREVYHKQGVCSVKLLLDEGQDFTDQQNIRNSERKSANREIIGNVVDCIWKFKSSEVLTDAVKFINSLLNSEGDSKERDWLKEVLNLDILSPILQHSEPRTHKKGALASHMNIVCPWEGESSSTDTSDESVELSKEFLSNIASQTDLNPTIISAIRQNSISHRNVGLLITTVSLKPFELAELPILFKIYHSALPREKLQYSLSLREAIDLSVKAACESSSKSEKDILRQLLEGAFCPEEAFNLYMTCGGNDDLTDEVARQVLRRACQKYGKCSSDVWLYWIQFEVSRGDFVLVQDLHSQARRTLLDPRPFQTAYDKLQASLASR